MNPSILYYSRSGSAVRLLLFLAIAVLSFTVAALIHADSRPPPPQDIRFDGPVLPMPAPRRDPLAPVKIPVLIVAGGLCLFMAGRQGRRILTPRMAARIEGGRLHLDAASYPVPMDAIVAAQFDRADRLPGEGPAAARLGARLRHGLYLQYRADASIHELRLIDNEIDGGIEQLRRFAVHLDSWRQSAVRTAQR